MINKISSFLENMRIEGNARHSGAAVGDVNVMQQQNIPGTSGAEGNRPHSPARMVSDKMILDAEKFAAATERPNGKTNLIFPQQSIDDEFFHLTCHVDASLIPKIERGEFVDLERLVHKDPTRMSAGDGSRLELVNKDGYTYFVPATDRDFTKITGVQKWEQAFCINAAIYTRANPHCAAEIWQCVYIINLAATSYSWDNVSCYDFAFRHLMAQHPECSWSTVFQQMWSLSMRDPINRQFFNSNPTGAQGQLRNGGRNQRDNYCWRFNKNRCKFGTRCKFDHCCYYCDAYGHGLFNCPRKSAKSRERDNRNDRFNENRRDAPSKLQGGGTPGGRK